MRVVKKMAFAPFFLNAYEAVIKMARVLVHQVNWRQDSCR